MAPMEKTPVILPTGAISLSDKVKVKVGAFVPSAASQPPLFTVKSRTIVSLASTLPSSYILTVKG